MKQGLIVAGMFISCSVLAPILWHLWIVMGTANANFYFGVTLAYNTAQVIKQINLDDVNCFYFRFFLSPICYLALPNGNFIWKMVLRKILKVISCNWNLVFKQSIEWQFD